MSRYMSAAKQILKAVPAIIVAVGVPVFIAVMSIPPDQAASNLSKWGQKFGISSVPNWLANPWLVGFYGATFVVIYVGLVWGIPWLRQRKRANDLILRNTDPRIRIEITEKPGNNSAGIFHEIPKTCFILHNEGGGTAYGVKMGSLDVSSAKLGTANVSFPVQESIGAGCSIEVTLEGQSFGLFGSDIAEFLDWACSSSPPGSSELTKEATVLYKDYRGQMFETAIDIVYRPNRNPLGHVQQFAVKNHRFRKIEPSIPSKKP